MTIAGQELWYVPSDRRFDKNGSAVTVTKVGRKWLSLSNGERIEADTLVADGRGYAAPGRCWLSEDHWLAEVSRRAAWNDLRALLERQYAAPDGLSEVEIRQAWTILQHGIAKGKSPALASSERSI